MFRYALCVVFAVCMCASAANGQEMMKRGDAILIGRNNGSVHEVSRLNTGPVIGDLAKETQRLLKFDKPISSLKFVDGRYRAQIAVVAGDQFTVITARQRKFVSKAIMPLSTGHQEVLPLNSAQYQLSGAAYKLPADNSLISMDSIPLPEGKTVRAFSWNFPIGVYVLDTEGELWEVPLTDFIDGDDDRETYFGWGLPRPVVLDQHRLGGKIVDVAVDSTQLHYLYLLIAGQRGGLVAFDQAGEFVAESRFSVKEQRAAMATSLDGTIFVVENHQKRDTVWHYEAPRSEDGFYRRDRFASAFEITAIAVTNSQRIYYKTLLESVFYTYDE